MPLWCPNSALQGRLPGPEQGRGGGDLAQRLETPSSLSRGRSQVALRGSATLQRTHRRCRCPGPAHRELTDPSPATHAGTRTPQRPPRSFRVLLGEMALPWSPEQSAEARAVRDSPGPPAHHHGPCPALPTHSPHQTPAPSPRAPGPWWPIGSNMGPGPGTAGPGSPAQSWLPPRVAAGVEAPEATAPALRNSLHHSGTSSSCPAAEARPVPARAPDVTNGCRQPQGLTLPKLSPAPARRGQPEGPGTP